MEFKERLSLILILLTIGACLASVAQTPVFFTNESQRIESNFSSDIALAVADVNNDFRDDLVRISETELVVHGQLNEGRLFKQQFQMNLPFDVTTVNIGNINGKNANDIFISGFKGGYYSLEMTTDFELYELVQKELGVYYAQGSSINDINNDGALDVLVTNDIGFNQTFVNDGLGSLALDDSIIDFKIISEDDSRGNYNGIWFDADQDNDLDLFISKCYASATSSADLRRINQLFVNENGTFVERADVFGLADGAQSWCADSGDLDNDGDIDLVLINHGAPSVILENNDGNGFIRHEVFSSNGMIVSDDFQVTLADYNNDGLLDISIAGMQSQMLLNKGNLQFESYTNSFGFGNMTSMATGDLNADGWLDILGVFGNAESGVDDRLLLNLGGAANHVTLSFIGSDSNPNGIGAKVEIYHEGERQIRWVKSGVAYGITNSLNVHFGLDDSQVIDSLICYWPSGNIDKHYDLEVNHHYILNENQCLEPMLSIQTSSDVIDCQNEQVLLMNSTNESVIWNNNSTESLITVNEPGYYLASGSEVCFNPSNVIYIDTLQPLIRPELTYSGELDLCEEDEFVLSTLGNQDWQWTRNGIVVGEDRQLEISESGIYQAMASNLCDTMFSEILDVNVSSRLFDEKSDTIGMSEDIELTVDFSDSIQWYDNDFNFITDDPILELFDVESDTLFYFKVFKSATDVVFNSMPNIEDFETSYINDLVVGGLGFRVNSDCKLQSVTVGTDIEGTRKVIIINAANDTVFSSVFDLEVGINRLLMTTVLPEGDYRIFTDMELNQLNFGSNGPQLVSVVDGIQFPVSINGYIDVEFSLSGFGDYSQFFDWRIEPIFGNCDSDFIPYEIILDTTVSNINQFETNFNIYPNPADDYIILASKFKWDRVDIINAEGEILNVSLNPERTNKINVGHLSQGMYFIRLNFGNRVVTKRFCKK